MAEGEMRFCTAVNCMDGRVQRPVLDFLSSLFMADFVDQVTEAGPAGVLAADPESALSQSIYSRIRVSVKAHGSIGIGVVAHYDCAGNPKPEAEQREDLRRSVKAIRARFPRQRVVPLWVDRHWQVSEVGFD
jgi:hypothetical protein